MALSSEKNVLKQNPYIPKLKHWVLRPKGKFYKEQIYGLLISVEIHKPNSK